MIGRNVVLALFASLALALGPAAGVVAADGGAAASAKSKQGKKKGGKGKQRSCKAQGKRGGKGKAGKRQGKAGKSAAASARNKKGKGKKGKSRGCKGKGKGGSELKNGRYTDPETELTLKVSGGGSKIQLEQIAFRSCPIVLGFGSDSSVPLKTSRGQAVAKQTFTIPGGAVTTLSWSVAIDPSSLRYSLEYTLKWEVPSSDPEVPPIRCDKQGRDRGKLSR